MMRFIDLGIGVQPRVIHDAVDKVIDDGGNRIDAPKPVIDWSLYHNPTAMVRKLFGQATPTALPI
jgi:hypothetical protein